MIDHEEFFEVEADQIAELFGETGSLQLTGFLNALLSGYEGKTDLRDLTEAEYEEIIRNAVRFMAILETPED